MQIILKQCKRHSRKVMKADHEKIKSIASDMIDVCRAPLGKYPSALAVAHCQVDHDDPMRFFVTHDGRVIINPVILAKSDVIMEKEGCYSFPFRDAKRVKRFSKVTVKFEYMGTDGTVKTELSKDFEGDWARVFQHELDHFKGKAIY